VFNGCEPAEALIAAQRLRLAVHDALGLHPDPDKRLTVSIGVATLGPDDPSAEALLARADMALYAAKAGGRNTVCEPSDRFRGLKAVPPATRS
jgi:diguanylate cyclase (GGDEF)-like protein